MIAKILFMMFGCALTALGVQAVIWIDLIIKEIVK